MKKPLKDRLLMLLFPLPFVAVGIGLLLFSVMPDVYQWQQMKAWPQVEAELLHAELLVNSGEDSDTYRAVARYQYRYQGMDYTGERVAIMSGSDNIGNFQQQLAAQLKSALRNQRPVPAWVNPDKPNDAVLNRDMRWNMLGFILLFVAVFGGMGIVFMVLIFTSKTDPTDHPEAAAKPWLGQQEWASPAIRCNAKSSLWGIWIFAIIWNLISLPAALAVPGELGKGNTMMLVALLFPLVGLYLLGQAIRSTLSWRRFGQLQLQLDPYPGSIGGQVGGTIDLPLPYDSQQRFPVSLMCVHSYETGSGKERKRRESIVWQSQGLAHSQLSPSGGTRLGLCFDVPAQLPASQPHSREYHLWRLDLQADLPGVDLHRQFEVPVFATEAKSRTSLPLSSQHPHTSEEHEAQIEAVVDIEQIPGGLRLHFPMLRGTANNIIGLIIGLIFAGAGWGLGSQGGAPGLLVWGFILLGGGMAGICLKILFTSLKVQLDQRGLISERYWLGIPTGRDQIPRADILKFRIVTSYTTENSSGSTEVCKIQALTRNGKKIPVAINLKGRAVAQQALTAIEGLSGYGG